ncbi:MAG: hypothetical protein NZ555_03900 [Geminicoccaceae bacterium]|nr:hypothetical protein [Geminicoccaceae bacterium]MDW8370728.1 hypothetical protein [Geminicoccaceae bacterium]
MAGDRPGSEGEASGVGEKHGPIGSARAPAPRDPDRAARLAAALRANLRRRKEQARARAGRARADATVEEERGDG